VQSKIEDQKSKIPEWEILPPEKDETPSSLETLFKWLAIIMDGLFRAPGTKFRFGLNPLIDFVPVAGDVSAALVSFSVLVYAVTRGLPKILLTRMALNILINELVGVVPVLGSVFAFWFRANKRNYELLQRHIDLPNRSRKGDWIFLGAILGLAITTLFAGLIFTFYLLKAFANFLTGN
jgi:Domain of unknown function (DUF4112)